MAWYRQVSRADWATSADLNRAIRNASILKDGRAVFNLAGRKYRMKGSVFQQSCSPRSDRGGQLETLVSFAVANTPMLTTSYLPK